MSRDWDAATYDRVSEPQVEWARGVLGRLELRGDETVLDAGCGSGRVTAMLLERLPEGRVIGVDASESMVEHARERLGDRATLLHQDLLELSLPEPVDAIFSNAVFHWVPDHARLFGRLHAALKPGGRLIAQCGGTGNVERFLAVAREVGEKDRFSTYFTDWTEPWLFAGAEETSERLRAAGFEQISTWLSPGAIRPPDLRSYIATACLGYQLDRLPEELRDSYVGQVAEGVTGEIDYVRLNIDARRPG